MAKKERKDSKRGPAEQVIKRSDWFEMMDLKRLDVPLNHFLCRHHTLCVMAHNSSYLESASNSLILDPSESSARFCHAFCSIIALSQLELSACQERGRTVLQELIEAKASSPRLGTSFSRFPKGTSFHHDWYHCATLEPIEIHDHGHCPRGLRLRQFSGSLSIAFAIRFLKRSPRK
jgi:hypothetical protein